MPKRKTSQKSSSRRKTNVREPFDLTMEPFRIEVPKIEIPSFDLATAPERKRINPNKLSRLQLIGILSQKLSWKEIYDALYRLKKEKLAEKFKMEVERINQIYDRKIAEIEGKVEELDLQNKVLKPIIDEILSVLKAIYRVKFSNHNEFQNTLKNFLIWSSENLEKQLSKLSSEIKVEKEFSASRKDRLDIIITIKGWRIGIEVKYDLSNQAEAKRLLGQIDTYLPYCDAFIVVSYKQIPSWLVNQIKIKEEEKGKMIKLLAPDKII